MGKDIVILGVFAGDTTYRADRAPRMGETLLGNGFALGPGGKGSNQAVAAAKAGGQVHFITRLGKDFFADLAFSTWAEAGVTPHASQHGHTHTGAAYIFIEEASGDNAIIICPGAAGEISAQDVDDNRALVEGAAVFLVQLEQPIDAALHGLRVAREAGATTILNPAPAADLPSEMLPLCDYVTPNESEAEGLTGIAVNDLGSAQAAGEALLAKGVGTAIITMGAEGVLIVEKNDVQQVPAFVADKVVETTGAGDAFNGSFAVGLSEGLDAELAARFACAAAGLSVTRAGAAASMPTRQEIEALLSKG